MITILASIAGFIGSIIPHVINIFKDINDKKHEISLMDKKIEFGIMEAKLKSEEINAKNISSESQELYKTYSTSIKWVDSLNGTVRPMLAYGFFILYVVIKYYQYILLGGTANGILIAELIWSQEDQAIFAGIISFYFGQRAFSKNK